MSQARRPDQLSADDVYLFREGSHGRLYDKLGCQLDPDGAHFSVWAPNALGVAVIGDFNGWNGEAHALSPRADSSGLWEGHINGIAHGDLYKYRVFCDDGTVADKADPFAFCAEPPPSTASRAWRSEYAWGDAGWMERRSKVAGMSAPMSIYEVHLGSWRRAADSELPTYRELAPQLADYVAGMGFTHVELMPLRSTARGATSAPATSPPPRATARRKTSCS